MRTIAVAGLFTVALLAGGCHRTRTVPLSDALASPSVYVTLDDKTTFLLYTPKVYGAKLTGWVEGKYLEYPTERVKQVQVRESNNAGTIALVGLGLAGAATVAYLVTKGGQSDESPPDCDLNPNDPRCE
jgi:hypothetical protein